MFYFVWVSVWCDVGYSFGCGNKMMCGCDEEIGEFFDISCSQNWCDVLDVLVLGEKLVLLILVQLVCVLVLEDLLLYIVEVKCIIVYIVYKCQLVFLVKYMCCEDDVVLDVICDVLDVNSEILCCEVVIMYCVEDWCECLMKDGDKVLGLLLVEYLYVDCQQLCMLVCNVQVDWVKNKLLWVYCEIYQVLCGLMLFVVLGLEDLNVMDVVVDVDVDGDIDGDDCVDD